MLTRIIGASLLALLLSSCVEIPDVKVCTIAGTLAAGADCSTTNTNVVSELTTSEWYDFVLPKADEGGAACMSVNDFVKIKTAIQQLCKKRGASCQYEGVDGDGFRTFAENFKASRRAEP